MRTALPFLVPFFCLVGLAVAPNYASELAFALAASILTIALAAPSLIEAATHEAAHTKRSSSTPTPSSRTQAAPTSRRETSISRAVWLWRTGVGVEVMAILWTFVSLGGLVVAPEAAEMWSLHLGVSMLTVMVWTPLIVFTRPSDSPTHDSPSESFIPEAEQQISRPVRSRAAVAAGEDASSPSTDVESTRSLWSYGEPSGSSSGETVGDGAERPAPSSQEVSPGRPRPLDDRTESPDADRPDADRPDADRQDDASTGWLDSGVFDTGSFDRETGTTDTYDTGAIWGRWPEEDDPSPVRDTPTHESEPESSEPGSPRSLWSFPEEDDSPNSSSNTAPSNRSSSPFDDGYDTGEQEMAWHVLESIIEEDEASRSKNASDTWEPEEWPDFNYDV